MMYNRDSKKDDRGFDKSSPKGRNKDASRPYSKDVSRPYSKDVSRPYSKDVSRPYSKDTEKPRGKDVERPRTGRDAERPSSKYTERPHGRDLDRPRTSRDSERPRRSEEPVEEVAEDRLEGRNSVIEALRANRTINKLLIAKGDTEGSINQIIGMARERKIIVQEVDRQRLDMLSSTKAHQGVIAFVAMKDYVEVDEIIAIAKAKGEDPFIVILDEITDPHNLGSVMRTVDAVGAHGVIIPKRRAVGLTAAVSKAAAGAVEYVPVARVVNISQTINDLKKKNIWVVGADSSGDKYYYEHDLKGPIALVVGSEGEGMTKLVRESCDFVVKIPMKGDISSLNASVAGAVLMYEIMRQRGF